MIRIVFSVWIIMRRYFENKHHIVVIARHGREERFILYCYQRLRV